MTIMTHATKEIVNKKQKGGPKKKDKKNEKRKMKDEERQMRKQYNTLR